VTQVPDSNEAQGRRNAEGSDAGKLTKSIPIEKALDDVIVAYGQNGEAVRPENGYPLRLIVPGFEGLSHVKWLRRIKVVDEPYHARSESTGYSMLRPNLSGKAFDLGSNPSTTCSGVVSNAFVEPR